MKVNQLQELLRREPFKPFGIRLSNGNEFEFLQPRNLGAPEKLADTLFWFGEEGWAMIDIEHIAEVFEK